MLGPWQAGFFANIKQARNKYSRPAPSYFPLEGGGTEVSCFKVSLKEAAEYCCAVCLQEHFQHATSAGGGNFLTGLACPVQIELATPITNHSKKKKKKKGGGQASSVQ